jgi:SpoVK/Ycf46/Vps4 family AAA+-type ATPase
MNTSGDLGLSPKDVETNLQSAFRLAEAWDCVLLLDEADIFLDQRSTGDIERNSLVSGVCSFQRNSLRYSNLSK